MSINNKSKVKSNKHSEVENKELVERPLYYFELLEPDEVLEGNTIESYKTEIASQLINFDGALFLRQDNKLVANTNLSKEDILIQQSRKMRVDIVALINYLNGNSKVIYKNLDEFKAQVVVKLNEITIQQLHWTQVTIERDEDNPCYPYLQLKLDISKFDLSDYDLCNIINKPCYGKYLTSIITSQDIVVFYKPLNNNKQITYNRFEVDFKHSNKDIIVTFNYNVDLYFSHLKYLYKIINTYNKS